MYAHVIYSQLNVLKGGGNPIIMWDYKNVITYQKCNNLHFLVQRIIENY